MLNGLRALDRVLSSHGGAWLTLSAGRDRGALEVWTLRVAEIDTRHLDPSILDDQERDRAASLARSADRLSYTVAHVVLRRLLGRRLGVSPAEIAFGREPCPSCGGPNGRPILERGTGSLHFSMSRSQELALIAIASVRVGVDLEMFARAPIADQVTALLHADEREEIFAAPRSRRTEVLTRLWTRKEAYLKCIGTGIAHDLDTNYLGTLPNAAMPGGWTVLDLPVADGYAAAAAIEARCDDHDSCAVVGGCSGRAGR